jgi:hypothetical protein
MAPKLDYDMICGVGIWPLKKPFSDLFGITCANYAFVVDHMEFPGGSIQWNVSFTRVAYD